MDIKTVNKAFRSGFTLIELMIVVAIIGILAAIAIPKFADLVRKSGEGACKGNLSALRSALSIYYGDLEGQYPAQLSALTVSGGKYMAAIPPAKTPNWHPDSFSELDGSMTATDDMGAAQGWLYNGDLADTNFGNLVVNCTHTDTRGTIWTSY